VAVAVAVDFLMELLMLLALEALALSSSLTQAHNNLVAV
jgi:hypothetical protein